MSSSTGPSQILNEVLQANARCASEFGDKGQRGLRPARRFAILTCMDAGRLVDVPEPVFAQAA